MFGARINFVSIRAFVHEVLRRSRTSTTTFGYFEATTFKIPELGEDERSSQGVKRESEIFDCTTPAMAEELEQDCESPKQASLLTHTYFTSCYYIDATIVEDV
jgi:hypothetical protein